MKTAVGFHGRTGIVMHHVTSKAIVGRDGINDIFDIIFIFILSVSSRRRRRLKVNNGRRIIFFVVVVVVERKDSNDHRRTRPRSCWR